MGKKKKYDPEATFKGLQAQAEGKQTVRVVFSLISNGHQAQGIQLHPDWEPGVLATQGVSFQIAKEELLDKKFADSVAAHQAEFLKAAINLKTETQHPFGELGDLDTIEPVPVVDETYTLEEVEARLKEIRDQMDLFEKNYDNDPDLYTKNKRYRALSEELNALNSIRESLVQQNPDDPGPLPG